NCHSQNLLIAPSETPDPAKQIIQFEVRAKKPKGLPQPAFKLPFLRQHPDQFLLTLLENVGSPLLLLQDLGGDRKRRNAILGREVLSLLAVEIVVPRRGILRSIQQHQITEAVR